MDSSFLLERVMLLIPLVLSLTVHEFSHAWTAWRLGDDTAARLGRLTLNPLPHVDLVGTILLPLMGVPFGWAKPVPVDVSRVRRGVSMTWAEILISSAGPISNLGLSVVCAIVYGVFQRVAPELMVRGSGVPEFLGILVSVNVALALFNLLPIPPLDGGHVAGALVPYRFRGAWEQFARVAPFLLLGLVFLGRGVIWGVLSGPRNFIIGVLERIIFVVSG